MAADDFFHDLYETALEPGELLSAILVPAIRPHQRMRFDELARRRGDYAIVGVAANVSMAGGKITDIRLAFCAVGNTPTRATNAERALSRQTFDASLIQAAKDALSDDLAPDGDDTLSGDTKLRLARVLLGRVLTNLAAETNA